MIIYPQSLYNMPCVLECTQENRWGYYQKLLSADTEDVQAHCDDWFKLNKPEMLYKFFSVTGGKVVNAWHKRGYISVHTFQTHSLMQIFMQFMLSAFLFL